MALPPQLIGIKRRRHDEPVDVLYLDQDRTSFKRRFTEFVFQRLKPDEAQHPHPHPKPGCQSQIQERVRSASSHTTGGVPQVRATSPGAEIRNAAQRRAVRAELLERQERNLSSESDKPSAPIRVVESHEADAGPARAKGLVTARRFKLSRHNFTPATSRHSGGIRKHKHHNRSHIATFVEMHLDRSDIGELPFSKKNSAVDRLVDDASFNHRDLSGQNDPSLDQTAKRPSAAADCFAQEVQSFVKAPTKLAKTGNSIRDHPSTWDHDSAQLANELAAFALEIDRGDRVGKVDQHQLEVPGRHSPGILDLDGDVDDIYVYETYLRVRRTELSSDYNEKTDNIGMLVIEEQDEKLWQTFAEDDEDSEWDEEDGDSNAEDNPRNDYPEEEVSSEDEYGHGAYKYRHAASDDEEYDLEDPSLSDDGSAGL